jgi:hypothetical protein
MLMYFDTVFVLLCDLKLLILTHKGKAAFFFQMLAKQPAFIWCHTAEQDKHFLHLQKLTNKCTELYTSLFTRWLLHVLARQCYHQGVTTFLLSYFNVNMVDGKSEYNRMQ